VNRVERAVLIERRVKLFFFSASLILLFVVLMEVTNLLVSFLLAFGTYFLMAPAVDYMERKGISRLWATVIPFLALTLAISIGIYLFIPSLTEQVHTLQLKLPQYLDAINKIISHLEQQVGSFINPVFPIEVEGKIEPRISAWASVLLRELPDYLSSSFTILILVPFLTFFMLLDGREFVRGLIGMVPNNFFELVLNLNYQISSQIGGFIRARLIESIVVCLLIWIGLLAIGFPYALVLAIFAATLIIIPYLGPVLGALPAYFISLAGGVNSGQLLGLTLVYLAVHVIDAVVLVPFLVAKIVDLHPVTVVLAIAIGSQMMGILGMIICIPVVATLKVTSAALYRHFTDFRT